MSNIIYSLRYSVDLPEDFLEGLVGRPDDESDEWYEQAGQAGEDYVRDNPLEAIEHFSADEPEVDC